MTRIHQMTYHERSSVDSGNSLRILCRAGDHIQAQLRTYWQWRYFMEGGEESTYHEVESRKRPVTRREFDEVLCIVRSLVHMLDTEHLESSNSGEPPK